MVEFPLTEPYMATALAVCVQHHERMDGTGYPAGLKGDGIHMAARVVAVADVFDALTSDRPYRPALDPDDAWRITSRQKGLDVRALRALRVRRQYVVDHIVNAPAPDLGTVRKILEGVVAPEAVERFRDPNRKAA